MKQRIDPDGWYIITGINRLTSEREDISRPLRGRKVLAFLKDLPKAKHRFFTHPKVKPYPYKEEELKFKVGGGKTVLLGCYCETTLNYLSLHPQM